MTKLLTISTFIILGFQVFSQQNTIEKIIDKAVVIVTPKLDSAFVVNINSYDTLEYYELKALFQNEIKDSSEYSSKWTLMSVVKLDSLKANNGMEDYMANIDIGMIANSEIHLIGKEVIDQKRQLIYWGFTYKTLEACPYGYGSFLFASVINSDNEVSHCIKVAEYSGGGDPPVFGSTKRRAEWSKDYQQITTYITEITGEMQGDGEVIEKTEKQFVFEID